ncbi:MAG: cytochrome c maturation protein CcmE [Terriglobales bacterium]
MSNQKSRFVRFGIATAVIVVSLGYLAYTGVEQSKSYYVTIKELRTMDGRNEKRLRVAGNVVPGSIKRQGTRVEFTLMEKDPASPEEFTIPVVYVGTEAPPDTFKDDSQALAEGQFGRDGVFHAKQLQAKCASKYAPQKDGAPAQAPGSDTARPLQKAEAGPATVPK